MIEYFVVTTHPTWPDRVIVRGKNRKSRDVPAGREELALRDGRTQGLVGWISRRTAERHREITAQYYPDARVIALEVA